MNAEQIVDASIALTSLPARAVAIEDYARDLDDSPAVQACKTLAVKAARLGDTEGCLLALQHAAAKVFRYERAA